jgi:hypothetical protein
VTFHPEQGKAVEADINEDGSFSAKDVPVGSLRVTVKGDGVPKKYGDKQTSTLTVEITQGQLHLDLALAR